MSITKKLKAGIEQYTGAKAQSVRIYPDPKVAGTYAARAVMKPNEQVIDFIVVGNQMEKGIARSTAEEVAEAIEECEFDTWPPKSGALRFL